MIRRSSIRTIAHRRIKGRTFSHPIRAKEAYVRNRILRLIVIFFLTVLGCGGFFLLQQPIAEIDELFIDGVTTIPSHHIYGSTIDFLNSKSFGIPNRKTYIFDEKKLENYLLHQFPIEEISIVRDKSTLSISITEEITNIAWKTGDNWYLLNMNGEIVREAQPSERQFLSLLEAGESTDHSEITHLQSFIPLLIDLSVSEANIGENVIMPINAETILSATELLQKQQLNPRYFLFNQPNSSWFTVVTNEPFHIRLDGEGDINKQVSRLSLTLKEYPNRESLTYIDLRFDDHVFVKER